MNRNDIREIVEKLDKMTITNYDNFEVALMIFLRCGLYELDNYITDSDLEKIHNVLQKYDSILNEELKEEIDEITDRVEE